MSIDERTRTEIDRRLERLADEYGSFPVREETVTNDPEFFARGVELARAGWIGDAGAWVTDATDRVLLIRHEDAPERWGTPGGGHEPGETLEETARREVREETGVEATITGVSFARRKTVVREGDPGRRFHLVTAIFEATVRGAGGCDDASAIGSESGTVPRLELEIGDDEILEARWFAHPPDDRPVHDFLAETVEAWAESTAEE